MGDGDDRPQIGDKLLRWAMPAEPCGPIEYPPYQ